MTLDHHEPKFDFAKKMLIISMLIAIAAMIFSMPVNAKTNTQLIKSFCKSRYPGKKIKTIPEGKIAYKAFTNRKGKPYVYVIKFRAKSHGGDFGYTKSGAYVRFNKPVKKGKWAYTYYIYNPYTNYEDDVVARVANNKIVVF